jgi:MFS family permease
LRNTQFSPPGNQQDFSSLPPVPDPASNPQRLYTQAFFTMAMANFLILSSFSTFFLFPLFIIKHGGDDIDIGVTMGAFSLASVICRPWTSEMIDRIGRKKSYTIGCLQMSVLPLAYLLLHGDIRAFYLPLLAIRIVHGMGFAVCLTAVFTYITDLIPNGRLNEGLGIFGVSGLIGTAVGPATAELVIDGFGFSTLFIAAGLMATFALLIHLPLSDTLVHNSSPNQTSFFAVLKIRRMALVALLAVLFGFGLAASNGFVSPFASERQIPFVSMYYLAYSGSAVLTRVFGGRLADRLGEDRVIPYALILAGLGLAILVFLEGSLILVVAGLLGGCGHGFLYPALNVLAVRDMPAAIRGKITGAFTGSIDAGAFAGSIILGFVGQAAGFQVLFLVAGGALLSAFVLYRWGRVID